MDFFLLTMCSPDTRDVPYVPMWLICFIRALIYKKYDILPVTWATSVFFLLK